MPNYSANLDSLFHALSDPTRRRIVERLGQGEASVSDLAEPVRMALPSLLQHLRVLEKAGLIDSHKRGRVRICRLAPKRIMEIDHWLARQRAVWEARSDQLEAYLETLKSKEETDG